VVDEGGGEGGGSRLGRRSIWGGEKGLEDMVVENL